MSLNKRKVDAFRYEPNGANHQILYDGDLPGFGVRVYPSGIKAYIVRYRHQRRLRLFTLGRHGVLTVEQARARARSALKAVRHDGIDPLGAKLVDRDAATVAAFADEYMTRHGTRKKTASEDNRRLDNYVLPAIGRHKLASVTRADIARLHGRIGATKPYEANRVLALVRTMFSKAQEWGYLDEQAPNPARFVKLFDERSRDRFVREDEMRAVFTAIEEESNPYIRAAFKLYLFTGLRRAELLGLKWSDVDMEGKRLRLKDTKAGRSHSLPLSPPAMEILRDLPRMIGNPYVLPGHVRGKPLVNVTVPWKRIRARVWLAMNPTEAATLRAKAESEAKARKAASKHASDRERGIEARLLELADREDGDPIRIHDLRRTTGSWLAMAGASLPLIGAVLNHSNASTTQVYARLAEDAPRAALDALAEKMLAAR